MQRTIIRSRDVPPAPQNTSTGIPSQPDDYVSRLLKYIPTEVIVLYLTLSSLLRSVEQSSVAWGWLIFFFGLAATPLYLWRLQHVRKALQLIISTIAFAVWVFAMGGPFANLAWYAPFYGGVLLCVYTFLIPIIEA